MSARDTPSKFGRCGNANQVAPRGRQPSAWRALPLCPRGPALAAAHRPCAPTFSRASCQSRRPARPTSTTRTSRAHRPAFRPPLRTSWRPHRPVWPPRSRLCCRPSRSSSRPSPAPTLVRSPPGGGVRRWRATPGDNGGMHLGRALGARSRSLLTSRCRQVCALRTISTRQLQPLHATAPHLPSTPCAPTVPVVPSAPPLLLLRAGSATAASDVAICVAPFSDEQWEALEALSAAARHIRMQTWRLGLQPGAKAQQQ